MAPKKAAQQEEQQTLGLTDLRPAKGAVRTKLRVGRGRASGAGKTSNRGHNGEGQRSGNSRKRGFEGGQMPGYRRMPKFHRFTPPGKKEWLELNISDIEVLVSTLGVSNLTYDTLREGRFLKDRHSGVRVLGNGETVEKVTIQAHHVTPAAREKIEKAGGSIELLSENGKQ